jgi:hypothetical protein
MTKSIHYSFLGASSDEQQSLCCPKSQENRKITSLNGFLPFLSENNDKESHPGHNFLMNIVIGT